GHQLAPGPAMRALDRYVELLIGQIGERLERAPRVALLVEEFEGVEVHQTATGSRYSPKTSRRTAHCSPSVAYAAAQRMKCGMRFVSLDSGRAAVSCRPRTAPSTSLASRSRRVRANRSRCRSSEPG